MLVHQFFSRAGVFFLLFLCSPNISNRIVKLRSSPCCSLLEVWKAVFCRGFPRSGRWPAMPRTKATLGATRVLGLALQFRELSR